MTRSIITAVAVLSVLLGSSDAFAQTGVLPLLDSATVSGDTLTCWWGYTNGNSTSTLVPLGGANFFVPSPINRGQPATFLQGVHHKVFSTTQDVTRFTETGWTLGTTSSVCKLEDAILLSDAPAPDPADALFKVQDGGGTYRLLVTPEATSIDAPDGMVIYTNAERSNGVFVGAGSGSWSTLSDANRKTSFSAVNGDDVLARIARLPVYEWSYIGEADGVRHIGPTAQDFRAAFGLGDSDKSIATVDIDGVNLAALKALEARVRALEARLDGGSALAITEDTVLNVSKSGESFLTVTDQRTIAVAPGGFIIRTGPSTDVHLSPGAGSWSITSDVSSKRDIVPVDGERVLQGVRGIGIRAWRYIGEPIGVRHIGPTAQDFFAAFRLGNSDRTISMVDADGVTLAGIKALIERLDVLENSAD